MCRGLFIAAFFLSWMLTPQARAAHHPPSFCALQISIELRTRFEDEGTLLNALGATMLFRHPEMEPLLSPMLSPLQLTVPTQPFSRDVVEGMQLALSGYYYLLRYRTAYRAYWNEATLVERNDRNLHSVWNERAEAYAPHGDVGPWREIANTISPKVGDRLLADDTVPLLFRFGISEYLEFKRAHGIEVDHPIYRFYLHAVGKLWLAQRAQRGEDD